ncbi:hypothetical protein AB0M31_06345 [Streptomyces sp. NPDC051773]|uniref:hypothetical protein n=1 Tax=Streptomyces sp. NPDC051773 TaxID=3156682 RepID=UPI003449BC8F
MNEAWGAVVAAAAAGVFGVGGVLAGIYVGRRQTTDQAQVEHEQWLRGQRREAYIAFLAVFDRANKQVDEVTESIEKYLDPAQYDEGRFEEQRRAFFEEKVGGAWEMHYAAYDAVLLLGPTSVAEAATAMHEAWDHYCIAASMIGFSGASTTEEKAAARRELMGWTGQIWNLREAFFTKARQVIATAPRPGV